MKRLFAVIIAITIVGFVLWGCSTKSAVVQTTPSDQAKAQQNAAAPKQAAVDQNKTAENTSNQGQRLNKEAIKAAETKGENQFADLHFDFDKYNVNPNERAKLDKIAEWLKTNKGFVMRIEGNCDERGSAEYNLALGEKRAQAAMQYLMKLGVPKDRISIISYGKDKPLDPGHDEEAWAKNRRDHFIAVNK